MAKFSCLVVVLLVGLVGPAWAEYDAMMEPKWAPSIEPLFKPGNERTLGGVSLFLPLWQDDRSMVFGDIRGNLDTDSNSEGNFGLGYRRLLNSDWIENGRAIIPH